MITADFSVYKWSMGALATNSVELILTWYGSQISSCLVQLESSITSTTKDSPQIKFPEVTVLCEKSRQM